MKLMARPVTAPAVYYAAGTSRRVQSNSCRSKMPGMWGGPSGWPPGESGMRGPGVETAPPTCPPTRTEPTSTQGGRGGATFWAQATPNVAMFSGRTQSPITACRRKVTTINSSEARDKHVIVFRARCKTHTTMTRMVGARTLLTCLLCFVCTAGVVGIVCDKGYEPVDGECQQCGAGTQRERDWAFLQCEVCTPCPDGEYESSECTPTQDTGCTTCRDPTDCADGVEYLDGNCTATNNPICKTCDNQNCGTYKKPQGTCTGKPQTNVHARRCACVSTVCVCVCLHVVDAAA